MHEKIHAAVSCFALHRWPGRIGGYLLDTIKTADPKDRALSLFRRVHSLPPVVPIDEEADDSDESLPDVNFFELLDDPSVLMILSYLQGEDLYRARMVCRSWRKLVDALFETRSYLEVCLACVHGDVHDSAPSGGLSDASASFRRQQALGSPASAVPALGPTTSGQRTPYIDILPSRGVSLRQLLHLYLLHPEVRRLSIRLPVCCTTSTLRRALANFYHLHTLHFPSTIQPEFLDTIAQCCPHLHTLRLDSFPENLSFRDVGRQLASLERLENSPRHVVGFSALKRLKQLSYARLASQDDIDELSASSATVDYLSVTLNRLNATAIFSYLPAAVQRINSRLALFEEPERAVSAEQRLDLIKQITGIRTAVSLHFYMLDDPLLKAVCAACSEVTILSLTGHQNTWSSECLHQSLAPMTSLESLSMSSSLRQQEVHALIATIHQAHPAINAFDLSFTTTTRLSVPRSA